MNIPTQSELLDRIEKFCAKHDMAESRFGRDAVNAPGFVNNLRKGKSPTLDTLNKIKAFMDRTDDLATLRVPAPPPLTAGEEEEAALPFSFAPVNPTGASSPTSSLTRAPSTPRAASDRCRCSTGTKEPTP